jgi:hypothetical protein
MNVAGRTAVGAVFGLFTVAYVLSVTVYVVPPSAATFEVRKVTDRLVEPLFAQRWSFFAPAPPVMNTDTMAQARFVDDNSGIRTTDWFAVSAYLDRETKKRPIGPSRRYRTAANIERALLGTAVGPAGSEGRQFAPRPLGRSEVEARRRTVQDRYGDLAVRVATAVVGGQRGRAEKLASIRVRVVATPVTRFGHRANRRASPQYLVWESGWRAALGATTRSGP